MWHKTMEQELRGLTLFTYSLKYPDAAEVLPNCQDTSVENLILCGPVVSQVSRGYAHSIALLVAKAVTSMRGW